MDNHKCLDSIKRLVLRFYKTITCNLIANQAKDSDKAVLGCKRSKLEKSESLTQFKIPYEGEFNNNSDYYLYKKQNP